MSRTGTIPSHLLTDEVRRFFGHEPIGHEFSARDGDQISETVPLPMIDEGKAPADRSVISLFFRLEQRPDACIGPDEPGLLNVGIIFDVSAIKRETS